MLTPLTETTLPNGMKIFCLQEYEVPFIYAQVQEYSLFQLDEVQKFGF